MKFTVTFKTPDAAYYEVKSIVENEPDEDKQLELKESLHDFLEKFIKYGEVITIQFDTEAGTATVVPV